MRRLVGRGLRFLARVANVRSRSSTQTEVVVPDQFSQIESQHGQVSFLSQDSTLSSVLFLPPLEGNEIDNALQTFVGYPRCFSLEEFMTWLDSEVSQDEANRRLKVDPRFIWLGGKTGDEDLFIAEPTLFMLWSHLTLRLSQAKRSRLSRHELAIAMSSVRVEGQWDTPPDNAIDFGRRFGFVSHIRTSDHYVFPLARVISYMAPSSAYAVSEMLKSFADTERRDFALNQRLEELVQQGLTNFDKRVVEVVTAREGLQRADKMTLEQIGTPLGLTRERVRQIEARFWRKLCRRQHITMRPFLNGFLCDIIRRQGSLIVDVKSPDSSLRMFVAKCVGVPKLELRRFGLVLLGASPGDLDKIASSGWCPELVDEAAIASRLGSEDKVNLSDSDLAVLAEYLARYRRRRLDKGKKVLLALRHIGRPAHYSDVAAVYNSLFPNDESSENTIHAALNRQQYGVVWIGAKGMYGLTEWGCERPSTSIFNAVAEIVKERYSETGNPVPFTVIVAEMGKYRQAVHPTSLLFAAHLNPRLQQVTKDSFIPKEAADRGQEEITADELDGILRDFEEKTVCLHNPNTEATLEGNEPLTP